MKGDRTYTLKEAKDILSHIKSQHVDYCAFPTHHSSDIDECYWQYFDELSPRSKFLLLYRILNEKVFKETVFNLLTLIKGKKYPLMNVTFLSLVTHVEGILQTSVTNLSASTPSQSSSVTISARDKMTTYSSPGHAPSQHSPHTELLVEVDPTVWNPLPSEHLLHHLSVPSACGGVNAFPAHVANLEIVPSSLVRLVKAEYADVLLLSI